MKRVIVLASLSLVVASCGLPPTRRSHTVYADPEPTAIVGPRWLVRRAVCAHDQRPVADLEGALQVEQPLRDDPLVLTLELRTRTCAWTSRYDARTTGPCTRDTCEVELTERWRAVTGPVDCDASPNGALHTTLRRDARQLTFGLRSSALCRDRDTRMELEALGPTAARDDEAVARLAVAGLRMGDADALLSVLADDVSLASVDAATGATVERARGRDAVAQWLREHGPDDAARGLRFVSLVREAGRFAADWDHEGAEPSRGVTLVWVEAGRVTRVEERALTSL